MTSNLIIRSKAPLRLGLAGGGSDVSPYSDIYGGLILNATINLYAHCTIEKTNENLISFESYDSDCYETYPVSPVLEIDGKSSLIKGVYNRITKEYGYNWKGGLEEFPPMSGFKIMTYNDAPAGSGLGTSSTMVVAILKCFVEWLSLPLGDYEIARLAYEIERHDLNLSGGKQDQYAAAFGGFNYMEFLQNDMVIVNPLKVKQWIIDELESSIVLYFTGCSRSSAAIIDEQKKNTSSNNIKSVEAMHRIKQGAVDMKLAVLKGDTNEFARVLGQGWEDKKKMASAISNPIIEEAFEVAHAAGAKAGKISGAGGGGFIMFFVEPTKKKAVIQALNSLSGSTMPFNFTDSGVHGWKIYKTDNVAALKY